MQYNDYTINYQLNDNTFYIKVINNIMLTVYETTIDSDNFKYKLSQIKNIFDNCLKTKDIILNFIVSYNKLTINTIYKTEFMDIDFDIILNQVEVSNVSALDLNRTVFELEKELENIKLKIPLLENKLQYYEDMTPIIFTNNKKYKPQFETSGNHVYYPDVTFYEESHIRVLLENSLNTKITAFCNESQSKNISESNKEKYRRIRDSLATYISSDMLLSKSHMDNYNIIVPPKKIVKVWTNDNNPPTILGEGVHRYDRLPQIHLIWLGSIKYKDDIPDNFELANFKNFE
jgi:hypothetical protein